MIWTVYLSCSVSRCIREILPQRKRLIVHLSEHMASTANEDLMELD